MGLRFFRLTATLPHSEKPRIRTHGAPGDPSPLTLWSNVPITPTPRRSTFTSGGTRMVCPPMIEYEWISTSGDVKSAYRKSTTPPPHRANVVMRFGTFQRPRRSNPLMIANSSVDGAGLHGPPLRPLVTAPGRSPLIRSSSSYVCAAYALV